MKTLGIAMHSVEGGSLCLLTACHAGEALLGPHMHPAIVASVVPMALSLPAWRSGDHRAVAGFLAEGVQRVAAAGADFFVCPDNTAHIVLEQIVEDLPLPGLHIAEVVCREVVDHGWSRVGLLGTAWTMDGPVYRKALARRGVECLVPEASVRARLDAAIFDELCRGIFRPETTTLFVRAIDALKTAGAEAVILGCTEIPLIVNAENSPLPTLDSTRLLARAAVREAVSDEPILLRAGWLPVRSGA
jgi:aspartate racemase